jgi:hypothetical protein
MLKQAQGNAKEKSKVPPQNSQNQPGFPRAWSSQDDYNREEEKLPLPVTCKLL